MAEAKKAIELTDSLVLLGYCEFGKPYLNQIEVAEKHKAGVNPLQYENIVSDLDKLNKNQRAILYFHWGMEHVWLPPANDIKLAKKLLKDERVAAIIGMHCHRVQGIINYRGKKAYMGLGNFLFPNFYITPPTQIAYPSEEEKKQIKYVTRQYHKVYELTYKKWRLANRVSKVLLFDVNSSKFKTEFVVQDDNLAEIKSVGFLINLLFNTWTKFLSLIYKLPLPIYNILHKLHAKQVYFIWRNQIRLFQMRQVGIREYITKIKVKIKRKLG